MEVHARYRRCRCRQSPQSQASARATASRSAPRRTLRPCLAWPTARAPVDAQAQLESARGAVAAELDALRAGLARRQAVAQARALLELMQAAAHAMSKSRARLSRPDTRSMHAARHARGSTHTFLHFHKSLLHQELSVPRMQ